MDNATPMRAIDRARKTNSQTQEKRYVSVGREGVGTVQWLPARIRRAGSVSGGAEQLIERHAPRIVQDEHTSMKCWKNHRTSACPR
jgi:hypothetical protein